jgi:RNA polymerase-binding transcription factor DksA
MRRATAVAGSSDIQNSETYKRRLENRQHELHTLLRESRGTASASEADTGGWSGQPNVPQQISDALIDRCEEELVRIRRMLAAIEEGIVGVCQQCYEPITPVRLDEAPDAILCFWCVNY